MKKYPAIIVMASLYIIVFYGGHPSTAGGIIKQGNKTSSNYLEPIGDLDKEGIVTQKIESQIVFGWPRDGYDRCWTHNYPFATNSPISNQPFGSEWRVAANNPSLLTGDVNGDGYVEIVYTSNNRLYALNTNGNELWHAVLSEGGSLNILDDVTGDGIPEIIISTKVNTNLKLLFYDGLGNLIKTITESNGVNYDNTISARAVTDIDNDGDLEVVTLREAGYNLWYRGVEVFDYNTDNRQWFYSIGPAVHTLNVADINGDSKKEIVIGTGGVANGHYDNGYFDNRCYVICWDAYGNLLWSRQFEGSGFVDSEVSIADLDLDGNYEIICSSRQHGSGSWDGNLGRVYVLNATNGAIVSEYNAGKPLIVNGIADIVGNSNLEIVVNYKDGSTQTGKILLFDRSLRLLDDYSITGSRLHLHAINDVNGDGNLELIVCSLDANRFVVLDNNLKMLWSLGYPHPIKTILPTDLNNDGVNELLVSTSANLHVLNSTIDPTFNVSLTIQGDGQNFTRIFGGHSSATNGYDEELDVIAPPPGQTYHTYFAISSFPHYLRTEVRRWKEPYNTEIEWNLKIVNAEGITTTISWDPSQLPSNGSFTLEGTSIIDMRKQNSVTFIGNKNLYIRYLSAVSYTYDFPMQGWYMISLPIEPENSQVSSVFPTAMGGIAYEWKQDQSGYRVITELEIGIGYWLAIPGPTSVTISGVPLYTYTKRYPQGWHQIGSVVSGADFSNPNDNPDGMVLSQAYGWTVPNGPYNSTTTLDEKEGYWIVVFSNCDLTIGGGGPFAANIPSPAAASDWITFAEMYGSHPPAPPYVTEIEAADVFVQKEFEAKQNFPNPFNPETVIEYSLLENRHTVIEVFNLRGEKIRSLENQYKMAGRHQVVWNGRNGQGEHVPSGLYLIRVTAGDLQDTLKAMLIK